VDYSNFKLLTFDVVGTLIDSNAGIREFFSEIGCQAPTAVILKAFGKAEGHQQDQTPGMPFTQMLEPIYERMAPELGLSTEYGSKFQDSIPSWPAFPDSIEALGRLRNRFRLVALTNADNWALSCIAQTLGEPFDDTVTCEDVGVNKPDPQVFAYCRGQQSVHGITQTQTLHVAQSQYHDIGVSKRLGYTTCWIERYKNVDGFGASPKPDEVTKPDLHFATLKELADDVEKN
jgi:putative hydrolase of the HAD superfamily